MPACIHSIFKSLGSVWHEQESKYKTFQNMLTQLVGTIQNVASKPCKYGAVDIGQVLLFELDKVHVAVQNVIDNMLADEERTRSSNVIEKMATRISMIIPILNLRLKRLIFNSSDVSSSNPTNYKQDSQFTTQPLLNFQKERSSVEPEEMSSEQSIKASLESQISFNLS